MSLEKEAAAPAHGYARERVLDLGATQDRSPLTHAARIVRPLLIAHGANDPAVPRDQSDRLVAALKANKRVVTYVLYPDEGHGLYRPPNRMSFNAVSEAFLAQCLGGRAEPFGDDLEGSSLQVLEGVEHVAGLSQALRNRSAGAERTDGD